MGDIIDLIGLLISIRDSGMIAATLALTAIMTRQMLEERRRNRNEDREE